jgi:hypothetical protein
LSYDDANSDDGPRYFDHHNLDFLQFWLLTIQILNNNIVGFLLIYA